MLSSDPIRRRNLLLIAAALFAAIAFLKNPAILTNLQDDMGWLALGLSLVAGVSAAAGLRECGEAILSGEGWPWYTRSGSLPFLAVSLIVLANILFFVFSHGVAMGHFPSESVFPHVYLALSTTLLGIVFMQWPAAVPGPPAPKPRQPQSYRRTGTQAMDQSNDHLDQGARQ